MLGNRHFNSARIVPHGLDNAVLEGLQPIHTHVYKTLPINRSNWRTILTWLNLVQHKPLNGELKKIHDYKFPRYHCYLCNEAEIVRQFVIGRLEKYR